MSILKKLAGQTAVYGLSSIVGRFLNYLLVPMHTRVLTVEEYGVSSYFYAIIPFAAVFFTYGMETAFFRFYQKEDNKAKVFSTAFIAVASASIVLGLIIFLLAPSLAHLSKNDGRAGYFRILAVILAADAITTIPFAWLRQQNKPMRFALLRLLSISVVIGLNLFFYLGVPFLSSHGLAAPLDKTGVSALWIFVANVVGSLSVLPFFLPQLKLLSAGFDKFLWQRMFRFAFPVLFMGFAGMINETLDRILLKYMIADPAIADYQIGIYSGNYKLSIIITLFIQAFRFAAEPFFFAEAGKADAPKTYSRVMQYFMLLCAIIFAGVMLYLNVLKHYLSPKYYEGLHVVPVLLMANIALGAYYNLSVWFKITDRTRMGALVSLTGAGITIILNLILIPIYGYTGCAWATLVCYASMAIISYSLGQKYYPIPYDLKRIFAYLSAALGIYLISDTLKDYFQLTGFTEIFVNTILFSGFIYLMYLLEEKSLKPIIGRWTMDNGQKKKNNE